MEDEFKLFHNKEKLYAVVTIKGETYEMDVTDYFNSNNAHDDWLDYRLGLKKLAENSKLTKKIEQAENAEVSKKRNAKDIRKDIAIKCLTGKRLTDL